MDPAAERRDMKRNIEYYNSLQYVADSEYGIPTTCYCGGKMIGEVQEKEERDTLPGKRFFTCINYENDGLHYRQPWVIGVQQEIEKLTDRMKETEKVMKEVHILNRQIESLEVKSLSGQVDVLTVKVADLEMVCFD